MGRLNNDDQFKFLISCIRYSNNGKVDFTEVAKECNIVSKGAAAKRYERMMKAHGIFQSASTYREASEAPARRKEVVDNPSPKKRKHDNLESSQHNGPGDGAALRVKNEGISSPPTKVKKEAATDSSLFENSDHELFNGYHAAGFHGSLDGTSDAPTMSNGVMTNSLDGSFNNFIEPSLCFTPSNAQDSRDQSTNGYCPFLQT